MSKINKALDYNKLLESQAQGKLLKKHLSFPLIAQTKYDGNYCTVKVQNGNIEHRTSGGLSYSTTDDSDNIFNGAVDGYYIAERIGREGKLGDRRYCNLTGSKKDQKSTGHSFKVFDYLTLDEYEQGYSNRPYSDRMTTVCLSGVSYDDIVETTIIDNAEQLEEHLQEVVNDGYEGLMLYNPDFKWKDTKSRTVDLAKYKKRRTADLYCFGYVEGDDEGKYLNMIGSLSLRDSQGRMVDVGSGLSDTQRNMHPKEFIGKVIEVEYEQIMATYIQPTFIRVRDDKEEEDID